MSSPGFDPSLTFDNDFLDTVTDTLQLRDSRT